MTRYALLALPSANRVYRASAPTLSAAELRLLGEGPLGGRLRDVAPTVLGGVPYLGFSTADGSPLAESELAVLAHLSTFYALFTEEGTGDALLRPVTGPRADRFDDDLVTIPKYPGKTNEQFTRLLLNVTIAASAVADRLASGGLAVLDPLCGRGTTLNHALLAGHDAAGIELDDKDVEAYAAYLRTWLERKRLRHRTSFGPVRRAGVHLGRRFTAEFARSKAELAAHEGQRVDVVHADTRQAEGFFSRASFDVVVTDAPYGVQHASRGAASRSRPGRSPLGLLAEALPVWARLLRPGGAVGIAWNTLVAPRAELVALLAGVGLQPLDQGPYRQLEHRVDQAIVRDVVVARLPAAA